MNLYIFFLIIYIILEKGIKILIKLKLFIINSFDLSWELII